MRSNYIREKSMHFKWLKKASTTKRKMYNATDLFLRQIPLTLCHVEAACKKQINNK